MYAHTLPARNGLRWLLDSLNIYAKAQLRLPLVVLSYLVLMLVLFMCGGIGIFLFFICDPMFSVSLTNLSRAVEQGKKIDPGMLFTGFFKNPKTLLKLGAIYLPVMFAVLFLALILFRVLMGEAALNEITAIVGENKKPTFEQFQVLQSLMQLVVLLHVPPSVIFWHASVLAAWHDLPTGKALFFSFVGCMRNWRAFLVYAVVVFIALLLLPNLLILALNILVGGKGALIVGFVLITLSTALLYAGLYASYRDIFASIDETV